VNLSALDNLQSTSKTVSEFSSSVRLTNYLIQGIQAYMAGDEEKARSAFGRAKSTMPNSVTAFYYAGLISFQSKKFGTARSGPEQGN
jgi:hypothetical protein